MRYDVVFYCLVSLYAPHFPIIGPELQIGALVAALCLIPD